MSVHQRVVAGVAGIALLTACGGDDDGSSNAVAADTITEAQEGSEDDQTGLTVRPGRASWETGYFQNAIYAQLLEELGYAVTDPALNEYPPAEAYLAMAAGTFDFWANGWYSQHYTWHEQKLADGSLVADHVLVIGDQIKAGSLEGLVITKSVADEHGIESLDQIDGDPALASLFDTDGDGLGEVHGCPESWTCDDIIQEMIDFNGWTNLEQVKAEWDGLIATSIDRVDADEPVIQYTWSPSGHLTDLVPGETVYWLSLGGSEHVLDGSTPGGFDFSHADAAPLGDDCSADPCWMGWEVADIRVTANADFAAVNPVAVALFEVVELSIPDIASQNVRYDAGENTEADIQRHAAEWIEANRPLVDEWLATARAAG
ncbi:MAG: glycine betaine/L-proline ABC transporter substrate-binding protein ProX [Ilumatobacteraceae bacterium]